MTREEVEATLKQARKFGGYGLEPYFESLLAHDQAQRAVIESANKANEYLASTIQKWEQVCQDQYQQIEQQAKEIESHKTEIARLKNELSHWTFERFNQLGAENKTLREALQLLYDTQNGCPLPKYEADWTRAMELAEQVLKEVVG